MTSASLTPPELHTDRLILRMGTPDDIPAIVRYFNDTREFLHPWEPIRPPEFYQPESWGKRLEGDREQFAADRGLRLFLFAKADPGCIEGSVGYGVFNRGAAHHCYLGYALSESRQGQGLMTEAVRAANDYVFSVLNLHRIMANYMPRNQRSGNLLKRLGFTVEGFARDYLMINGRWEDHILTSLTNPAWQQPG
jgi:ribosomal-protein-alanine N-acetyltransferase